MVYNLINNDLHIEKEAFVYYPNINAAGEIVSIDTDDEGFLRNCCFHSLPYGKEPLQIESDAVRFFPDDRRYAELAAYVFANRMLEFFQGLGYQWQDYHQLQLSVHAQDISTQRLSNNASYEPATTTRGARILIADGDNHTLQNLALDFDVVAHEFAHHVIYRTLKARHEQAVALHEGLADYFYLWLPRETAVWVNRSAPQVRLCAMSMSSVCAPRTMICRLRKSRTNTLKGKLSRLCCGICTLSGMCLP